jgi:hypothetical protein
LTLDGSSTGHWIAVVLGENRLTAWASPRARVASGLGHYMVVGLADLRPSVADSRRVKLFLRPLTRGAMPTRLNER